MDIIITDIRCNNKVKNSVVRSYNIYSNLFTLLFIHLLIQYNTYK